MLWRVKNFKGLRTAELDIQQGKATILTGVNSSGKSSVIQSLLLAAQSLQSENQVVLNGPLVRLGDAQDLVREGADGGAIELAIGLESGASEEGLVGEASEAVFDLVPADDRSSLRTRRLRIGSPGRDKPWFEMGRENSRASDVALAMQATRSMGPRDVLHVKSLLHSERRQLRTYVVVKGLRPVAIVQL
jgi:energy-coupling factor transporter ATP-binding protein EcfA2